MEFITDNYIWFIVGGIVIIMAIIGYIADKTDFGRKNEPKEPKQPKEKKEKKQKIVEPKQEKIEIDAKGLNDLTQSLNETNKPDDLFVPMNDELPVDEALYMPLSETNPEAVVNDSYTPLNNVDESLYAPFPEMNNMELNSVDESLYTPLSQEAVPAFEPMQQDVPVFEPVMMPEVTPVVTPLPEEVALEPVTIEELPNFEPTTIEPVVEETNEPVVVDDEDVWKF